jgi:hypothetical protein
VIRWADLVRMHLALSNSLLSATVLKDCIRPRQVTWYGGQLSALTAYHTRVAGRVASSQRYKT